MYYYVNYYFTNKFTMLTTDKTTVFIQNRFALNYTHQNYRKTSQKQLERHINRLNSLITRRTAEFVQVIIVKFSYNIPSATNDYFLSVCERN